MFSWWKELKNAKDQGYCPECKGPHTEAADVEELDEFVAKKFKWLPRAVSRWLSSLLLLIGKRAP